MMNAITKQAMAARAPPPKACSKYRGRTQTADSSHIHDAFDTKVQVARFLSKYLTTGCQQKWRSGQQRLTD